MSHLDNVNRAIRATKLGKPAKQATSDIPTRVATCRGLVTATREAITKVDALFGATAKKFPAHRAGIIANQARLQALVPALDKMDRDLAEIGSCIEETDKRLTAFEASTL